MASLGQSGRSWPKAGIPVNIIATSNALTRRDDVSGMPPGCANVKPSNDRRGGPGSARQRPPSPTWTGILLDWTNQTGLMSFSEYASNRTQICNQRFQLNVISGWINLLAALKSQSPCLIMRNRLPSGETSYVRAEFAPPPARTCASRRNRASDSTFRASARPSAA
jgi:hypothetical protein